MQYQYNKIVNLKLEAYRQTDCTKGVCSGNGFNQPFGSGATCYYPYRDLMIRNDTNTVFQLKVKVDEKNLTGEWHGSHPPRYRYEMKEKEHLFKGEYWGGFSRHNKLYRERYTTEGEYVDEEYITENHALMMYTPFLPSGQSGI